MILRLWLDQPIWLMAVLLVGIFVAISSIIIALTNLPATRPILQANTSGVVPTFFSSIGILLALLTGFVANEAWDRYRQGARIVQTERASLIAAHDISIATESDMSAIREALLSYVTAVIDDEWPVMEIGHSSPRAGEALSRLLQLVSNSRHTAEAGVVAHTALMNVVLNLRAARSDRLTLSTSASEDSRWITLFALTALTLVAISVVHVEKPRAQVLTLTIFSTAMIITLAMIALHEQPFDGPLAIGPTALESAKAVMTASRAGSVP